MKYSLPSIARYFPEWRPKLFFDVGANIGQSIQEIRALWPAAEIHSFEPVPDTFDALQQAWGDKAGIRTVNMALGSQSGTIPMSVVGTLTGNRIAKPGEAPRQGFANAKTVEVPIDTLERYAAEAGVDRISFLKIDAEGHDLEVLKGARRLFEEKRVEFVQVECAFAPDNKLHVPFYDVGRFFDSVDYRMLGIYHVIRRTNHNPPRRSIDFANVVYFLE